MIEACNSSITLVAKALPLNADFTSPIIDFRDSSHAAIQAIWTPTDSTDGVFVIHGSLLRLPSSFDDNDVDNSNFIITSGVTSHLWIYKKMSFRYMQLRWKANATTTGTVDIYAMGKKV